MTQIKIGQTWLSGAGNLWRVTEINDNDRVTLLRVGVVLDGGDEYRVSDTPFCAHISSLDNPHNRIVSRCAGKYDSYLSTRPIYGCNAAGEWYVRG